MKWPYPKCILVAKESVKIKYLNIKCIFTFKKCVSKQHIKQNEQKKNQKSKIWKIIINKKYCRKMIYNDSFNTQKKEMTEMYSRV